MEGPAPFRGASGSASWSRLTKTKPPFSFYEVALLSPLHAHAEETFLVSGRDTACRRDGASRRNGDEGCFTANPDLLQLGPRTQTACRLLLTTSERHSLER